MEFEVGNRKFERIAKRYFRIQDDMFFGFKSICALDNGKLLGGFLYTPVKNGRTYALLLSFDPSWATREAYSKFMEFPVKNMEAKEVAGVLTNKKAENIAMHIGATILNTTPPIALINSKDLLLSAKRIVENA